MTPDVGSGPATLVQLLRSQANDNPHKSYTFLADAGQEEHSIEFRDLHSEACRIAAALQQAKLSGQRVLLLYPPGLDFICGFAGCLYAGVIAVPAPHPSPLHLKRTLPRLVAIARDASPAAILTCSKVLESFNGEVGILASIPAVPWVQTDRLSPKAESTYQQFDPAPDDVAYLQYTSGATAEPKGVIVSHANVMANLAALDSGWEHSPDSVLVSWLPFFHDMGLVYGLVQSLYVGCRCYLMAPFSFIRDPFRWLQAISQYRGTHSAAPNFAYDLCVEKISADQRATLDLRCWKVAVNGSEPVRKATIERFATMFEACGFKRRAFCPGYGLAEATLKVTASRHFDEPAFAALPGLALKQQLVVGCGCPGAETRVMVVDPDSRAPVTAGQIGEIWVSGPGVARGYWRRPLETAKVFHAQLRESNDGAFLRTGDLGFQQDGELFVSGRLKDLIIIRGSNHFPADIEEVAQNSHPDLRGTSAAAFSIEAAGKERLIVVQELPRKRHTTSPAEIANGVRRAIADSYEIDADEVILVKAGTLPKTSSGKLARAACKVAFASRTLEVISYEQHDHSTPPRSSLEQTLADIVAQVLGVTCVGVTDDFLELGGDSIQATQVVARVRAALSVDLPHDALFAAPTVAELAILVSLSPPSSSFELRHNETDSHA